MVQPFNEQILDVTDQLRDRVINAGKKVPLITPFEDGHGKGWEISKNGLCIRWFLSAEKDSIQALMIEVAEWNQQFWIVTVSYSEDGSHGMVWSQQGPEPENEQDEDLKDLLARLPELKAWEPGPTIATSDAQAFEWIDAMLRSFLNYEPVTA